MEERDTKFGYGEYKGHPIDTEAMKAFYEKNNTMSFILKKTEKIVTAIYMVTDFMPESEPLRLELRTSAIFLLSKTRLLSKKATEPDYIIVDDLKYGAEGACSFLNLAVTIGLVSNMNGNILINELEKVSKELQNLYNDRQVSVATHPGYANIILTENMFDVPFQNVPKIDVRDNGHSNKGQEKTETVLYKKQENIQIDQPLNKVQKESAAKTSGLGLKIARRNDVLNIVKAKGQVSVKDIILMLKDVSEKTIQRELFALVKEGVLKKEGEKRWSVYKLV